jgi:hypothetical protein
MVVAQQPQCPLCRGSLTAAQLVEPLEQGAGEGEEPPLQQQARGSQARRSAKVEALMARLGEAGQQGIRSVVFSQFTGAGAAPCWLGLAALG